MFKQHFLYFKRFVAFLVICSLMIVSMPLNSNAAQDSAWNQNEKVYICDGYTVTFTLDTVWNSGYNVSVVIQNTGSETISDWYMYLKYTGEIPNMWNASVYETPSPYMVLTNAVWNKDVYPNGTAGFGFTGKGEFPGFPESIKVTSGYDPTAMEAENNNHGDDGGDTTDDGTDRDGDGLSDTLEEVIGSNPELIDSDEDGLSDYIEYYLTWTSPILIDTDENGIGDAYEDADGDGLGNLDEVNRNTNVVHHDTDKDDLSDYDEIYKYSTDPLKYDTDGDELGDGDDVLLGFSPKMPDTDLNGIIDSEEKVYQTTENDFEYEETYGVKSVSVSLNVSGNIDKEIGILNGYDFDIQSREVVGLIGVPVDIRSDVAFDEATITFEYDDSMLGDTAEEDLSLMWYDEENHWYQALDQECVVDTVNNTVSYTTTHFSKYFLVDLSKWISTWMEDIDYGDIEIGQEPREVDLILVSDEDVFVEDGLLSKISLEYLDHNFPSWANDSGRIYFEEGLSAWYGIDVQNHYKNLFLNEESTVYNPYYGNTMDSVLRSIMFRLDLIPELYKNDDKIVVLVSDGDFKLSEEVLNECIDHGIKIYTVDVVHGQGHERLEHMSEVTGGQYYYGAILDDPEFLWDCIVYDSGERLNGKDKDGDGLLDVYETEGMRTLTGRIITTNPDKNDSDDDNLDDSTEIGPVYDLNLYIGRGLVKSVRFIVPNSDPNNPDTDEDGMTDDVDPYPSKDNIREVTVNNAYPGIKLIRMFSPSTNSPYNGGAQRFWEMYRIHDPSERNWGNIEYITYKKGCGLIAASNLEIFLGQTYGFRSYPYSSSNQFPLWDDNGVITLNDYMNYVDCNREYAYPVYDENSGPHGVRPRDICSGFTYFLSYNGIAKEATWADSTDGKEVLAIIKEMINSNLPTVCAILLSDETIKVNLYGDLIRAINMDSTETPDDNFGCDHHYVNIIGYVKIDNNFIDYDYYLIVEADTKIYYVDYKSFSSQWNEVMNVLHYEI